MTYAIAVAVLHLFYKLLKLHKKKVRYRRHCDFLQTCRETAFFPMVYKYVRILTSPFFSNGFENNWNQILHGASRAMTDLIFTGPAKAQESVERNIMELEKSIAEDFGATVLNKFSDKVPEIQCGKLQSSLAGSEFLKLDFSHCDTECNGTLKFWIAINEHQRTVSGRGFCF